MCPTALYICSRDPREVKLTAKLTDVNGDPLPDKPIDFYYRPSGTSVWHSIGTSYTDSAGTAVVTVRLGAGTYDFMARFRGDDRYEPSEAVVHNVVISESAHIITSSRAVTSIMESLIVAFTSVVSAICDTLMCLIDILVSLIMYDRLMAYFVRTSRMAINVIHGMLGTMR